MNVRSALEYVPYFRGRLFVLGIDAALLGAEELVDALLDVDALHEIGVRVVLIAEGTDTSVLARRAAECELHAAVAEQALHAGAAAIERVSEIIGRRQVAIVASGVSGRFDEGSVNLAVRLGASKYICLQAGEVPLQNGTPIFAIREKEVEKAAPACSHPEVLLAAAALCRRGIPRVHLLDGHHRGVLLDEFFSEEGVGTMVHTDSYRDIRPLHEDDIPELLSMIARSVVSEKLIPRDYEGIRDHRECYYVYTLDDTIVGCVALYPYPETQSAELGCLFIKKNYEGHGYGRALCRFVEKTAKEQGVKTLFAISQSAVSYFRDRLGYAELSRDALPPRRRASLEASGRTSAVFGRML